MPIPKAKDLVHMIVIKQTKTQDKQKDKLAENPQIIMRQTKRNRFSKTQM
jgi:hypothetical protein